MSVAERVSGPDLPERAELVRAALAAADRARFDAELDQALDTARQTTTSSRSGTSWRRGTAWCCSAATAVPVGQPPKRSFVVATDRRRKASRSRWRSSSSSRGISPDRGPLADHAGNLVPGFLVYVVDQQRRTVELVGMIWLGF